MGTTEPAFLNTLPQYHFGFFGPNMRSAVQVKLPLTEFVNAQHTQGQPAPDEPIVRFNERPEQMEAWRLDHDYKPPSEKDLTSPPTQTHERSERPSAPNPPGEGGKGWS